MLLRPGPTWLGCSAEDSRVPGASGRCGLWPESVWNCSLSLLSSQSASWLMSVKCDKGNAARIFDFIIEKKTFREHTAIKGMAGVRKPLFANGSPLCPSSGLSPLIAQALCAAPGM